MDADLSALVDAVAPVAGSQIAFVASPGTHWKIMRHPAGPPPYPVFPSGGLAAKTVVAVAVNALAVGFGDEPGFSIKDQASMHMEDTNPLPLAAAGTPPVVAAPVQSLFQTDCLALRLILDMSWTLRAPNSTAWLTNVTW